LINALMLRPVQVAAPERLAALSGGIPTFPWVPALQGYNVAAWTAVRDRADEFAGAAAWFLQRLDLARSGEIEPVDTLFVSGQYFQTLGVGAVLGHVLQRDDEPGAVLSYSLWQHRFGGRADVLGEQLFIERVPFTVVGVAPEGFFGTEVGRSFDVAVPMHAVAPMGRSFLLNAMITRILVRLKPDQSIDAATARLRALQPEIRRIAFPDAVNPGLDTPFTLTPAETGSSVLRDRFGHPMLIVFAVVVVVLLVACANLANLLLARAAARTHEMGVRRALGATRARLIRLLLAESVLLAGVGSLLGYVFAEWGAQTIVHRFSTPLVRFALDTGPDLRVLAFTGSAAVLTVVLCGLAPAWTASRVDPMEALRLIARTTAGAPSRRLSGALVAGQVALSIVVVAVAALLGHSFVNAVRVPLGFDAAPVLLVTVNMQHGGAPAPGRVHVVSQLVDAIRALPDVAAAGVSTLTPSSGVAVVASLSTSASGDRPTNEQVVATNAITPGWLRTYGMSVRAGRDLEDGDMTGGQPVMLVNDAFAGRFLRRAAALGETIVVDDGPRTVVGIVSDAIYNSPKEPVPPTVYLPLRLMPPTVTMSIRVRAGRPTDIVPVVRQTIERVNRDIGFSVRTLADQVNASTAQDRVVAQLSGSFSLVALLLAALGIYGVTAYGVAQRRSEMAIRLALGAKPSGIVRTVLRPVWVLMTVGAVIGTGLSLWAAVFLRSLLFGVDPRDPGSLIAAVVVLVGVGILAGSLPAWRASRTDPAVLLRES
jgi:putative ABC transport system permease protein